MDPRIRRTREMLFKAFQDLLKEKTFDQISIQDLADRSTLNRATFYDHFTDKFGLLEAMIAERFSTFIEGRVARSIATGEPALRELILATCDFLVETSFGGQKHQPQFGLFVESGVKTLLFEIFKKRLRKQKVKSPELKATMVSWAITGVALRWSRGKKTSSHALAKAILPTLHTALEAEMSR